MEPAKPGACCLRASSSGPCLQDWLPQPSLAPVLKGIQPPDERSEDAARITIDLSEIAKPRAKKTPKVSKVRDASDTEKRIVAVIRHESTPARSGRNPAQSMA